MKLGISTYCLVDVLRTGEMSILDVLGWAAEAGCEHVELVPYGYTLVDNLELAEQVRDRAAELGLTLSSYSMPANFYHEQEADFLAEIARLKQHIDLLAMMGIRSLRHDVVLFTIPQEETTLTHYLRALPQVVAGSQMIADYAAAHGITTNVENHGWGVQHSQRVEHVINEVARDNFRAVLDIGNFMCVDEASFDGVRRMLPYASLVHVKDFHYRPWDRPPGGGKWFRTSNGNYLRGAIAGQGDIPLREILAYIRKSGYDGYLTLEFEGMEDSREGTRLGLENIRRLWAEAAQ